MIPRTVQFIRWWVHQLRTFDCDPSIVAMKYIITRLELNSEQRYWFCFLYANTYHLPTAWVLFNEFPDYENAVHSRIDRFSRDNISRLPYQKDQKWLRGRLGDTFNSYQKNLKGFNQEAWFATFINASESPEIRFTILWEYILKEFYLFGRYTAWFYLQALAEICQLPIQPTSLMLNFDASKTHRAGLCLATGYDDWATKEYDFTQEELDHLDNEARAILKTVQSIPELHLLPVKPDYFSMETACCSFKKLFRRGQGRYLGFYHDRFAEDILKTTAADWPGINWQLFWDFRSECLVLEVLGAYKENKWQQTIFLDTQGDLFHQDGDFTQRLDKWLEQYQPLTT